MTVVKRLQRVVVLSMLLCGLTTWSGESYAFANESTIDLPISSGPYNVLVDFDVRHSNKFVAISLHFPRAGQRQFELGMDDWAGLDQLDQGVSGLRAEIDGKPVAVTATGDGKWLLQSDSGEDVSLHYRIDANTRQLGDSDRVYYRPVVNASLFHGIGHNTLILPRSLPGKWQVRVRWQLPAGAGWKTATSFAVNESESQFRASADELAASLFMAGKLRVLNRSVHEQPVYLAIHGSTWQFTDEMFADRIQLVMRTEREFVGDYDFPYYVVSVIGVGKPIEHGYSLGGTRLHRNFALFLNPNATLEPGSAVAKGLDGLLMHETFHEWNGGQLSPHPELKEGELYWFTEGLTDFYSRKLLYQSGLRSFAETVDSLSELLANYHSSPARDLGNAEIVTRFWQSADIQKLPYYRGDLLALYLDRRIQQASNGRQSLDDLFFALLEQSRKREWLTSARVFSALNTWLSDEEIAAIRSFVERGGEFTLPAELLPNCLALQDKTLYEWEAGFDINASTSTRIVRGVVPGSSADKAGLRNGDRLDGWSIHRGGPVETPLTLHVKGRDDPLVYFPRGKSTVVPHFVHQSAADCPLYTGAGRLGIRD